MRTAKQAVIVAAVTALTAALCSVVPAAQGEFRGRNGKIAFMRDDGERWQLWVANADLTDQRQLTSGQDDGGWPVWAPHGRDLIAFQSERNDPDIADDDFVFDIFLMRPDGTSLVQLTDGSGYAADPAWSPDGNRIAFDDDFGDPSAQGIFTMRANGTDIKRVTSIPPDGEFDAAPRYSPDGRRLVFTRVTLDGDRENAVLYVVDVDGRHLHRVTPFSIGAGDADWSPDGRSLVFEGDTARGYHSDVLTVHPDGTHLHNLTHYDGASNGGADPVYAPDGTRILFLKADFDHDALVRAGLATMQLNGSHQTFVSSTQAEEHQPDWQSLPY